jgi:hypothetical protein
LGTDELIGRENAEHRCGVCGSGRGWRRFELVRRRSGADRVVRAGAEPALGTIRRWDASSPVAELVRASPEALARRSSVVRWSGGPAGVRIVYERLSASCLGRSRRRWPLGRRGSAATKCLPGLRTWTPRGGPARRHPLFDRVVPCEVAAAMDRLEAPTRNLRIVRERARVR